MQTLRIKVTKRHIKIGRPRTITLCPIAHALKDCGISRPSVECNTVEWRGHWAKLPRSAEQFIERFDRGLPVKPFCFKLVPEAAPCR